MTNKRLILVVSLLAVLVFFSLKNTAAEKPAETNVEYVTLRWGGRDNTTIIRPDGSVEITRSLFMAARKPDRVDERSYYMNVGLNALARDGFELVSAMPDEIILKRKAQPNQANQKP